MRMRVGTARRWWSTIVTFAVFLNCVCLAVRQPLQPVVRPLAPATHAQLAGSALFLSGCLSLCSHPAELRRAVPTGFARKHLLFKGGVRLHSRLHRRATSKLSCTRTLPSPVRPPPSLPRPLAAWQPDAESSDAMRNVVVARQVELSAVRLEFPGLLHRASLVDFAVSCAPAPRLSFPARRRPLNTSHSLHHRLYPGHTSVVAYPLSIPSCGRRADHPNVF